ncbi:flagellar protein FlgN [bacterium]|nr:flagellar protein FlgN [bacterium]
MDELIQELIETIKIEETLLQEFLDHLEMQKDILVKNDVRAFEESVSIQEALIKKIRTLEEDRILRVRVLAKGLKMDESELTLTRLVELSLGQVNTEMLEAKKSITSLVGKIKKVNQVST